VRTPANLADIVELTVARAASAAVLKDIELTWSANPRPPFMDIDANQIERALTNLIDNAIQYTAHGGRVAVTVSTEPGEVVVSVPDNGRGIAAAELPTIFEKYRRRPRSGGLAGSGLGLFVVKAIVAGHGGSIVADSVVERGTTMTLRLPLAAADSEASTVVPR